MMLRLRQVKEYEDGVILGPHPLDRLNPEIDDPTFAYFVLEWNEVDGRGWRKIPMILAEDE